MAGNKLASFYPSQRYIDRNLAPEQVRGGVQQLAGLADAIRTARQTGMDISGEDERSLLANALTENRFDFGMRPEVFRIGGKERRRDFNPNTVYPTIGRLLNDQQRTSGGPSDPSFAVVGTRPGDGVSPATVTIDPANPRNRGDEARPQYDPLDPDLSYQNAAAYLLRALMKKDELRAPSLTAVFTGEPGWNGAGKVVEDGRPIADASNHARKVATQAQMLDAPQNSTIANLFSRMLKFGGKDVFYDARDYRAASARGE